MRMATKLGGYDFYRSLGSPKFMCAPMVDQSELAFRILCRRYNTDLCYSPMLHSRLFMTEKEYRSKFFTTRPDDRPLIVQFCANDPDQLLAAAKQVEDWCDAVDINLGCPQHIAKRGHYGSFLMEEPELIHAMIRKLHENLKVPVTCKIRVFPELDKTIEYAKGIQAAGCQMLGVHGRTREQKGHKTGLANWDYIKAVKEALTIPVIANGNVRNLAEAEACLAYTGCDGVMSAEGLLANPALFSGKDIPRTQLAQEYLEICADTNTNMGMIRGHLFSMVGSLLSKHVDLRSVCQSAKTLDAFQGMVNELHYRVTNDIPGPSSTNATAPEPEVAPLPAVAATGVEQDAPTTAPTPMATTATTVDPRDDCCTVVPPASQRHKSN